MKWFGRTKKRETVSNETKNPDKFKKIDETVSEKTVSKTNTQKIETENNFEKNSTDNETKNNIMDVKQEIPTANPSMPSMN